MLNLDDDFSSYFPKCGYLLKPFQKKVISNVIKNGNTLCIMQTGGGKSVIYWMSAVELKGITLVISPLIALISEQSMKLKEQGYDVLELHSGISAEKQMNLLKDFANKKITPNFIFVSPEKIATDGFFEYCIKRRVDDIKLLVIDEVHCVSQWGLNFRPFYKRIPNFLNNIFNDNWCRILALTATLNPKELCDVCLSFNIKHTNIIKDELLLRSEITLHTQKFINEDEKEEKFWDILRCHKGEKTLVYVYRKEGKRSVEDLQKKAFELGYTCSFFHGDMTAKERQNIIKQFRENEVDIVFATNAFGMGIDIPDIRLVIHYMIPESAEQYYQEVGRAARDHCGANAYLLYSNKNIQVKETHFIDKSFPNREQLIDAFDRIRNKNNAITTYPFFENENENEQKCLPYFIESGLIEIIGKGFDKIPEYSCIKDQLLKQYYESTKTHAFYTTVKKNGIQTQELSNIVYKDIVDDKVCFNKPPTKYLILNVKYQCISEDTMEQILKDIEQKCKYKHDLLDYFVYILDNNSNSQYLHQEIACYLGMDKHKLNCIYETEDGHKVRSKSEVIICNLLYKYNINYEYESKLYYGAENKYIEPDFTIITTTGKKYYWEHVGMLGKEDYANHWLDKANIYEKYFPDQLLKTYETSVLSNDAKRVIEQILLKN